MRLGGGAVVGGPVQLNGEQFGRAIEIQDVAFDAVLSPEFAPAELQVAEGPGHGAFNAKPSASLTRTSPSRPGGEKGAPPPFYAPPLLGEEGKDTACCSSDLCYYVRPAFARF